MHLNSLILNNFRNISKTSLTFSKYFNIIYGNNGNGKTNLIESIYYLTSLTPIKDRRISHLITHTNSNADIEGVFYRDEVFDRINILLEKSSKTLLYNGNKEYNISNYLYNFKSILFTPDDLMLIKGEPEKRRKYFNKAIFQIFPLYFKELRIYKRVLQERNALIKELSERRDSNKMDLLDIINQQFVDIAIVIFKRREQYLKEYYSYFLNSLKELSGKDDVSITYKTSSIYNDKDEFLKQLEGKFLKELTLKRTLLGPHIDDYELKIDNKLIKHFGSQGEIRIFLLAIKISHILYIYEKTNQYPILLLDDISSELDEERNNILFNFLEKIDGQVFITSTSKKYIPELKNKKEFFVKDGQIES